jgi:hypothetical protein
MICEQLLTHCKDLESQTQLPSAAQLVLLGFLREQPGWHCPSVNSQTALRAQAVAVEVLEQVPVHFWAAAFQAH